MQAFPSNRNMKPAKNHTKTAKNNHTGQVVVVLLCCLNVVPRWFHLSITTNQLTQKATLPTFLFSGRVLRRLKLRPRIAYLRSILQHVIGTKLYYIYYTDYKTLKI